MKLIFCSIDPKSISAYYMVDYRGFKSEDKNVIRRRVRFPQNCCGRGCCFEEVAIES